MDIVEFYRTTVTGKVTNVVPRLTLAASFFNLRGCRLIIDVGGNDGFFASLVKGVNPDIVVDSIDLCEELYPKSQSVRVNYNYDVTKPWPITSDSYDGIHLGAIIEHVFDYKTLFDESFRILKPGGFLFISTPNVVCLKHRIEILFGRMPSWYGGFDHIRLWTASFLRKNLANSRFKVLNTYSVWERNNPGLLRILATYISSLMGSILIAEAIKPLQ